MSQRTPRSHRKVKPRPTYYEDIYGVQNADEAFDRSADVCESEPDTADERTKPSSTRAKTSGFFKPYTLESDLRISDSSEEDETAPLDRAGAVKGIYSNVHLPYHDSKNTARIRVKSTSKPNLFQKKPAPSLPSPRKLTPRKKFGMFGNAPPTPDTDSGTAMERVNTSDTVNSGDLGEREGNDINNTNVGPTAGDPSSSLAVADPGTGEGVFAASAFFREMANKTLQLADNAPSGPQVHYPGFELSDFINEAEDTAPDGEAAIESTFTAPAAQMMRSDTNGGAQNAIEGGTSARSSPMPGTFPEETEEVVEQPAIEEDEEDENLSQADQDDTQDQIQIAQPKRRGRPPKTATLSKQPANAKATLRSTRSAAQLEAEQGAKIADRVRKRRSSPTQPTKPSPRKKATARTATLRRKAKRVDFALIANGAPTKRPWVVSREKTMTSRRKGMSKEVRNWKGEKLEVKGMGYVKVGADVEDLEEYVKYD
ncbi:hypothetical protein LTR02_011664 [Friedmanniomyces endolithicus]|nr:hypothetical protein LTR94_005664 [Friedmanniomyces endolithicus]KAK0798200.1 hypothetical protein LTR59_006512 [Friedmanniomyces endolithicus]KAK0805066.1 hypothetical protein LTR38_005597 [Friedmanniomyces endolithicus]KAK0809725.1 hypothetical protein LTR75_005824 [Friedmanniomyces endolithicus]KAK0837503.1 hypothetical protein LTR03_012751 [Friedmanniomyces endolithicus]